MQAQTVAVLGLTSEDSSDELARQITDAVRDQVARVSGWNLHSAQPSLPQMTLAHDCEISDAGCRAIIGEGLSATYVIYGGTSRAPVSKAIHVELMMFESFDGSIAGVAAQNIPIAEIEGAGLPEHARSLVDELRGVPARQPEPTGAATVREPQPTERVDFEAGAEPMWDDEPTSLDWLGYTLLGTAAISTGLAVYSWTQIDAASSEPSFEQYRVVVGRMDPEVDDVCEQADAGETYGLPASVFSDVQDQCGRGRTFEVLQYVFLGAAVVSGGVGAYLLLSDDSDDSRAAASNERFSLTPRVGTTRVGLDAKLAF